MCACFPFPFPFLPNLDCCLIVENISYLAWWWLLNLCKEFAMTFVYLYRYLTEHGTGTSWNYWCCIVTTYKFLFYSCFRFVGRSTGLEYKIWTNYSLINCLSLSLVCAVDCASWSRWRNWQCSQGEILGICELNGITSPNTICGFL